MNGAVLRDLNRLFDHEPNTAAYEMLWAGLELYCVRDAWVAYDGAAHGYLQGEKIAARRTIFVRAGETIRFTASSEGPWSYLMMAGGWLGDSWFGSRSAWPEGGMGACLKAHDSLYAATANAWQCPPAVNARFIPQSAPPKNDFIRVWKGPQWEEFDQKAKEDFFLTDWRISEQSSRAGYRLQGPVLTVPPAQLISEPTLIGSIQIAGNGQPIVLLNDGPTVGGYHKIALIDRDDLDHFRQTPPGQKVRFSLLP